MGGPGPKVDAPISMKVWMVVDEATLQERVRRQETTNSMQDFEEAFKNATSSVNKALVGKFEKWQQEYGAQ